ncbi:hypothetical protein HG531_000063 [Fusarium graminearum]|nr:hypothetical protein HG531_000063 [Fusarium graminearum]
MEVDPPTGTQSVDDSNHMGRMFQVACTFKQEKKMQQRKKDEQQRAFDDEEEDRAIGGEMPGEIPEHLRPLNAAEALHVMKLY